MINGKLLSALQSNPEDHHVIIEPPSGWRFLDLKEILRYRDLFRFLVYRAIRTRYAQSALGISWAIIQPLATMLVFTIIFGRIVQVKSDGAPYALFSFVALVPWTYFQDALADGVQCLIAEQNMISKIYFPRVILPLSRILARFVDFIIATVILFGLLLLYRQAPGPGVLLLPFFILIIMLTSGGLALWLGAMAVQYRDIAYGMNFLVRLLMYAAPVVYPASAVKAHFPDYYLLYGLNPMVGVIEGFRSALLGTIPMPWEFILPGAAMSLAVFLFGALYFRRKERVFADVV